MSTVACVGGIHLGQSAHWQWATLERPDGIRAGTNKEESTLAEKRERMGLRPGQLDPQTAEIGHRMRELSGRKAYLRNFWYAAGGCTRFQSFLMP